MSLEQKSALGKRRVDIKSLELEELTDNSRRAGPGFMGVEKRFCRRAICRRRCSSWHSGTT